MPSRLSARMLGPMRSTAHLYNARLGKVAWFVKRFGVAELARKPLRLLFAPVIIPLLPRQKFEFRERKLEYFYHRYNMTWATERCVEVPIGRFYADQFDPSEILEVGNVLSHYGPVRHEVLDKFEKGPGIINQDVLSFVPNRKYRLVLSISTFEHIGFDDESSGSSGARILEAVQSARRFLRPDGMLVLTVPIGYNPDMDLILAKDQLAGQKFFLERTGPHAWAPANKSRALSCRYGKPFPYANAVLVAELPADSASS